MQLSNETTYNWEASLNKIFLDGSCSEAKALVHELLTSIETGAIQSDDEGKDFWNEVFPKLFGFSSQCKSKKVATPMNAANLCPEPKLLLDVG